MHLVVMDSERVGAVRLDDLSLFVGTMASPGNTVGCPSLDAPADGDINIKDSISSQLFFDAPGYRCQEPSIAMMPPCGRWATRPRGSNFANGESSC